MTFIQPDAAAIAIERPGTNDFNDIMEVWEASVRATHFFPNEGDFSRFRELMPRYLELVDLYCTRDAEGAINGFLGTAGGKIEMLFIRPEGRGRGIGRALLRYAIHNLGLRKVDVNEQNVQATGFYLHAGFRFAGRSERDGIGKPYPLLHLEWCP
jgi:putative acetyltransferase